MLTYNNQLPQLKLPEYGRNIQQMVDYCLTIEDRGRRSACAAGIVATMETLFPASGDKNEYRRKLWDHLLIMSDFRLDVDSPYEHVNAAVLEEGPDPIAVPYGDNMGFRHYGAMIEGLIAMILDMEDGPARDELVFLTASQMKKLMLNVNSDGVDDRRIFDDLRHMSQGAINVPDGVIILPEYKQLAPQGKKKKKK